MFERQGDEAVKMFNRTKEYPNIKKCCNVRVAFLEETIKQAKDEHDARIKQLAKESENERIIWLSGVIKKLVAEQAESIKELDKLNKCITMIDKAIEESDYSTDTYEKIFNVVFAPKPDM